MKNKEKREVSCFHAGGKKNFQFLAGIVKKSFFIEEIYFF